MPSRKKLTPGQMAEREIDLSALDVKCDQIQQRIKVLEREAGDLARRLERIHKAASVTEFEKAIEDSRECKAKVERAIAYLKGEWSEDDFRDEW